MRTIAEIYAEIVADKDGQTSLQNLAPNADTAQQLQTDLNSSSKVAIWRLWAYMMSVAIWTHESFWEVFRAEVDEVAANAIAGTIRWYQEQILGFQFGDLLTYNNDTGRYTYPTITVTNQIVERCVVIEQSNGSLAVKVAKLDSGQPIALTTAEQTALAAYIKKFRFAGTKFILISGAGDILKIEASIYYDALVEVAVLQALVEASIVSYVSNLPFNGEFVLSKLIDEIQLISGINDVVLSSVKTKEFAADSYQPINRIFEPTYGYFKLDDTAGNTLVDTINYIAQ